jgi:hypothetical protein
MLKFLLMVFFCKNLIITLVFGRNAKFLAENWRKITEHSDYNIDPR